MLFKKTTALFSRPVKIKAKLTKKLASNYTKHLNTNNAFGLLKSYGRLVSFDIKYFELLFIYNYFTILISSTHNYRKLLK